MPRDFTLPPEPIVPENPARPQRLSPPQAMALAGQLQAQGRLQESEAILRQILQAEPNHAQALHLLGVIAHQAGQPGLAIDLIEKAIRQDGRQALFHANLGEMYRQQGDLDRAIRHGREAVALDAMLAAAHSNLGIAYYDNREYERAEACQRLALKISPGLACALNNMGSLMRERKKIPEAIDYYRQAAAKAPNYLEPLNNLGAVLVTEERADEALEVLAKALSQNPQYADAHCNIGFALKALEQPEQAYQHFQTALQLKPTYAEAYIGIGRIHQEQHNLPEAERAGLKAIELAPDKAEAHSLLGAIYTEMDQTAEALACFDRALALDPELSSALLGKGHLCLEMGDLAAAEQFFRQDLSNPGGDKLGARFHLTQARKVRPDDDNMAALVAAGREIAGLPATKRLSLHFALGKCYDDTGDYQRAMHHYQEGCRLKRSKINYDPVAQADIFSRIIESLSQPAVDGLHGMGDLSELPIFVLGMPRSGTTLTEQILASHPFVLGGGELPDLLAIAHRPLGTGADFPDNLRHLTPETLAAWGTDYIAGLRRRAPAARRITDKMPGNFMVVGLIHLMLPNARIVHVNRNPVDTCLSCFTRLFHHGQEQTYDLTELGRYYRQYNRLMAHWRDILPPGAFLDLRYEELVADTETQSRRLLDFCGLPWDDACLAFHATERKVRTASITQVRQPIYTTSVERWRRYGNTLAPLLDALGDLVPAP
ncbi:MAG: tetratricopeptide repeat protein [Desulfobulbaceae bacterium]|nr:tetratricopeptide repeat protein [Desulfobulbaceae bacterium]